MTEKSTANQPEIITVTPSAVEEVKRLMAEERTEGLFLRLGVAAGGCSGMSYSMAFDNEKKEFDREFDFGGLKVVVELRALNYLQGTILDYKGGLMGGGFSFSNPNATRSCGCGSSFSC